MEYPSSGMTCYNKHQHLQSMNNDCNPLIQDQYNGPDQHLLYTINASQDNGSSSELDSRALLNMNYMNYQAQQQHMTMAYGDGLSLSESSVCSSIDIRSPDIHPVPDTIGMPSGMVAQAITHNILSSPTISQHCNSNMMTSQQTSNTNPVLAWPSSTTTDIAVTNSDLMINHQMPLLKTSSDAMTHNEDLYTPHLYESMNSDQSVKTHRSIFHLAADTYVSSSLEQNDTISPASKNFRRSTRKSPNHRRNTVSLPYATEGVRDLTEKDLRRQSMNDLQKKSSTQQGQSNPFCHLSREQLIQRVVELEKEKRLSSGLLDSNSPVLKSAKLDVSDENDFHSCRWTGCGTSATSLDQLIAHIKDVHIGSGKAIYYCQWESCPREQKPFLKRHKMQNHMRTHTGERPFECPVEDCDKKFSRPDSLNTHIKTHSSVRPYACPIENCTKAYFHSRSLRKHSKSHEILNKTSSLANATLVTASTDTTSKPVDSSIGRGEDITFNRQLPYDRPNKPPRYYHQQQSCGSEALHRTPTHATRFTPMIVNTNQQEQPIGTMHHYEQQTFAAGTAYHMQQEQLHYQQQQLLYQEEKSQQAYVPFGSSVQQHYYQQQQELLKNQQNPGYNYIY